MWPLAMGAARLRPIPSNRQCSRSGSGRARPLAHLGPRGGRSWGGECAGVGARRGPAASAGVAQLWRRHGLCLDNKWHVTVLQGLGKGHGWLLDRGRQGEAQLDGGGADGAVAWQ
jgi:hypothetical protein